MAVPMPPRLLYMSVALTTVEGVDAEATVTALDMVGTFDIKYYKINVFSARYCVVKVVCVRMYPRNQK